MDRGPRCCCASVLRRPRVGGRRHHLDRSKQASAPAATAAQHATAVLPVPRPHGVHVAGGLDVAAEILGAWLLVGGRRAYVVPSFAIGRGGGGADRLGCGCADRRVSAIATTKADALDQAGDFEGLSGADTVDSVSWFPRLMAFPAR